MLGQVMWFISNVFYTRHSFVWVLGQIKRFRTCCENEHHFHQACLCNDVRANLKVGAGYLAPR